MEAGAPFASTAEDGIFAFGPGSAFAEAEVEFDVVGIAASADRLRWAVVIVVDWHTEEEPRRNEAGRLGCSETEQLDRPNYEQVASADSYCEVALALLQDIWTDER